MPCYLLQSRGVCARFGSTYTKPWCLQNPFSNPLKCSLFIKKEEKEKSYLTVFSLKPAKCSFLKNYFLRKHGKRLRWRWDQLPWWGFSAAGINRKATKRRRTERTEGIQNILCTLREGVSFPSNIYDFGFLINRMKVFIFIDFRKVEGENYWLAVRPLLGMCLD